MQPVGCLTSALPRNAGAGIVALGYVDEFVEAVAALWIDVGCGGHRQCVRDAGGNGRRAIDAAGALGRYRGGQQQGSGEQERKAAQ